MIFTFHRATVRWHSHHHYTRETSVGTTNLYPGSMLTSVYILRSDFAMLTYDSLKASTTLGDQSTTGPVDPLGDNVVSQLSVLHVVRKSN